MKNFATLLFLVLALAVGVQADKVAIVSKVQGDVLLQKADEIEYNQAVTMGTILENNDQIKVNDGFAVVLLLDDKSQVKLRENTEVAISMVEDLSGAGYHVRLDYGQALTKYSKGAGFEFQLHTPTSVASIKGTEFWTISDPETGDQVIVLEGVVDVMNNLTGMISTAGAGQTVSSSTDGYIETGTTEEGSVPEDPEGDFGAVEPEAPADTVAIEEETEGDTAAEETAPAEDPMAVSTPTTAPSTIPGGQTVAEPEEEEEPAQAKEAGLFGDALSMNGAFGAVTIDGQLYNQMALRPDISVGKLGVGLDVVIYMNQDGDIRTEDWNDASDVLDKIMYIRWGQPQDPLYVRVGTLERVVMGYGLFINNYNNMMEYPSVRKIGTHVGFTVGGLGVEAMVANVKELVGLTSLRTTYSLGKLKFGATVAADVNQYLGFKDSDGDGRPNIIDDFPDDANSWLDSDGDGIADEIDYDKDNDNILEVGTDVDLNGEVDGLPGVKWEHPDSADVKPNPFDLTDKRSTLAGVSVDIGYPILSTGAFDLLVFAEAGQYLGNHYNYSYGAGGLDSVEVTHGWGLTAPGIRATLFKFIHMGLEYRMTGDNFVFSMFDQNYDLDRVGMQYFNDGEIMKPYTRDARLLNTASMQGVFGSLGVDILGMVTVNGAYQHMIQSDDSPEMKGVYGSIDLAKDLVPKLAGASAYVNRMNVEDPWDIYSEGTLMGYKVVFEIGGGATLTWDFRQTFRDLDGSGDIDRDSDEVINTTVIETGFSF